MLFHTVKSKKCNVLLSVTTEAPCMLEPCVGTHTAQGKFVIFVLCQKKKSSRQTLNQNLFHNPKCHQMIFKHFLASNLLLSCFSLNKFKMLSVQVCWHTA